MSEFGPLHFGSITHAGREAEQRIDRNSGQFWSRHTLARGREVTLEIMRSEFGHLKVAPSHAGARCSYEVRILTS